MHLQHSSQMQNLLQICNKIQAFQSSQSSTTSTKIVSVSSHRATRDFCAAVTRMGAPIQQSILLRNPNDDLTEASSRTDIQYNSLGSKSSEIVTSNQLSQIERNRFTVTHQKQTLSKRSFITGHEVKESTIKTPFGTIYLKSRTYDNSKTRPHDDEYSSASNFCYESSITLHPADWLIRLGLKCGLNYFSSSQNWQKNIRIFRVVPDDSLIFDCCETGNIDSIQTLLKRGEASVWDRNSDGWTPLHVSH